MSDITPLRFGYFKDFADPTFMFYGQGASLGALQDALQSLPKQGCIKLDEDSRFARVASERVSLCLTPVSQGFRQRAGASDCFEWRLSGDQAMQFAQLIKGVIDSPQPCHEYLEIGTVDDVVIVVSKDEYPEEWPQR